MAEMILVVDDETEIAELVEVYLKNEGYLVKKASCAAEALHIADTQPIALALLDVMLPDLDGFTLCRKIREKHLFPLIMLTAKTEDVDKITGLTLGADDYITKPFNPLEVVARVKTQLRRYIRYNQTAPEPAPAAVYDCGGLYIDHESHTCTLYGKPLSLTPLEFEILWYLCSRKGHVVSSEELFEAVWAKNIWTTTIPLWHTLPACGKKWANCPASPSGSKRYGAWGTRSMNKQNSKHKKLVQFWLCGIGFTIGMVVLFGLGYILCHLVTWQSYETPYILLKMAEFGIAPVLFLAGWGFLIYRFFFYVPRAVSDRSRAIRRLWLRTVLLLFLSIVLWLGLMILLLVGISSLLRWDIVWNGSASMAYILQTIRFLTPFLAIVGVVVISLLLFRKPFSYLQEIVQAAEQMQQEPEKPITLSAPVKTIQDELNRLRESSNQNALAAKEAEQRKNDLIVYLAHDLKTPLTSVIGYLSLLQDEPEISQELRAKYTGIALNKAQRLEELINQFFEITRFQLTHMELEWETIHFSRMLEQTAFEFQPILEEKHLQLQTEIAPDVKLTCDPDKLERVVDNLIRNAISYSYPDTAISLEMHTTEEYAVLTICNTGRTISPEKLDRIFEQFFRGDSSRATATGGAGLGLAIAKQITELHGGTIKADSRNEQIRFTVTLPLRQKIV